MPRLGTAFLLLSLGSLSGCTAGAPATTAVEAAQTTPVKPTHPKFQLMGTQGGEFLVDSDTGTVWQYHNKPEGFVRVPVQPEDDKDPLGILGKTNVVTPQDMKQ